MHLWQIKQHLHSKTKQEHLRDTAQHAWRGDFIIQTLKQMNSVQDHVPILVYMILNEMSSSPSREWFDTVKTLIQSQTHLPWKESFNEALVLFSEKGSKSQRKHRMSQWCYGTYLVGEPLDYDLIYNPATERMTGYLAALNYATLFSELYEKYAEAHPAWNCLLKSAPLEMLNATLWNVRVDKGLLPERSKLVNPVAMKASVHISRTAFDDIMTHGKDTDLLFKQVLEHWSNVPDLQDTYVRSYFWRVPRGPETIDALASAFYTVLDQTDKYSALDRIVDDTFWAALFNKYPEHIPKWLDKYTRVSIEDALPPYESAIRALSLNDGKTSTLKVAVREQLWDALAAAGDKFAHELSRWVDHTDWSECSTDFMNKVVSHPVMKAAIVEGLMSWQKPSTLLMQWMDRQPDLIDTLNQQNFYDPTVFAATLIKELAPHCNYVNLMQLKQVWKSLDLAEEDQISSLRAVLCPGQEKIFDVEHAVFQPL